MIKKIPIIFLVGVIAGLILIGCKKESKPGNVAPQAKNITITGNKVVGQQLIAEYIYYDPEYDPENGTSIQWYIASDTIGAVLTPIAEAVTNTYTLLAGDKDKYIKVGIVAKSSIGISPGPENKSKWIGPIGAELPKVTFDYNGDTVTYGSLISSVTGRIWLDRNLGASRVATAHDDANAYGDQFQWGRPDDGHQVATANTTSTLATSDIPGHGDYITITTEPNDWRSDNNNNRWNIIPRGPCPNGWHVPTQAEWAAETGITNYSTAFTQLKLTAAGFRYTDGVPYIFAGQLCKYWTSTISGAGAYGTFIGNSGSGFIIYFRAAGFSVRCIKD